MRSTFLLFLILASLGIQARDKGARIIEFDKNGDTLRVLDYGSDGRILRHAIYHVDRAPQNIGIGRTFWSYTVTEYYFTTIRGISVITYFNIRNLLENLSYCKAGHPTDIYIVGK